MGCFPDSFQRAEVGVLCGGTGNSARLLQVLLYLVLSLAHSFWLNKVSCFPAARSLITRLEGFLLPGSAWSGKRNTQKGDLTL